MSPLHDVVITGTGLVSALAHEPDELLTQLAAGAHALTPHTDPQLEVFGARLGAYVTQFKPREWVSSPKSLRLMSPAVRFGLAAIKRAWRHAQLEGATLDPQRAGLFVGAGTALGSQEDLIDALQKGFEGDAFDLQRFAREGLPRINPLWLLKGLSNNVLGFASADLDLRGVNQNYCNSAAGGLQAIGEAAWALAEGLAEVVVAGGADSGLNMAHLTGFSRLRMLYEGDRPEAVSPFDAGHAGFALGEGAAFFVLERAEHARQRGAAILARVVGYGQGCAAGALPSSDPQVIAQAGRRALQLAGWRPEQVDAVYAHGNGTAAFDEAESQALLQIFGAHRPPVTSHKAQLGHTLAASGPLSVAVALEGMAQGVLPGLPHLRQPAASSAKLNLSAERREIVQRRVLVHAAGLGGQTTFLALETPS